MTRSLLFVALTGCSFGGAPLRQDPLDCEAVAIRDAAGDLDPCDVAACEACNDVCDEGCMVLESYPPQYACAGHDSFTVYDECPDWQMPDSVLCTDTATVVTADDATLGFSANDVLAPLGAPMVAAAEWVAEENRPDTVVTLTVAAAGDPILHDQEPVDAGSSGCTDALEVPVTVALRTDDGAFDEVLATSLFVTDPTFVSVGQALDWQALGGDFTFVTLVPADWDSVALDLSTTLSATPEGGIQVSAERSTGPDTGEGLVGPLLRWPPM